MEIMAFVMGFKHCKNLSGTILPLNCFVFSEDSFQLRQLQPADPIEGHQECMDPLVISQYPVCDTPAGKNDLHRDSDHPIEKPAKLHGQELIPMLSSTCQQSKPRFESPGQSGHDHV